MARPAQSGTQPIMTGTAGTQPGGEGGTCCFQSATVPFGTGKRRSIRSAASGEKKLSMTTCGNGCAPLNRLANSARAVAFAAHSPSTPAREKRYSMVGKQRTPEAPTIHAQPARHAPSPFALAGDGDGVSVMPSQLPARHTRHATTAQASDERIDWKRRIY